MKFSKPTIRNMPRVSITIPEKNAQPYRFALDREVVTIGRSSENDIVIDCPSVSSKHCTMERVPGGYILRDRKSTNGIRLEEEYMYVVDLFNDADVRVGDVQFGYTLTDEELDELDEEEFESKQETLEEYEERKGETDENEKPKKKKVVAPARSSTPFTPPQMLASSNQGTGFLYGLSLIICGFLALYAGLNLSYTTQDTNLRGRSKGDFSLFSDIKDGRPPAPESEEGESE